MNKLIYSTGSVLSYLINEKYYNGNHYVWCAPKFNCYTNPPSSNPRIIMQDYLRDVTGNDRNSLLIKQNKYGIKSGVEEKCRIGVISEQDMSDLFEIIDNAELSNFYPVVYAVYTDCISSRLEDIPIHKRASDFSSEILVTDLSINEYDILDITGRLSNVHL